MTVVQAYICAKHYQVAWWSLWLAYWRVLIIMGGLLLTEKRLILSRPLFQPGRADLPKIHDLAANVRVLVTQGISVNSSYSSDVQVWSSPTKKTFLKVFTELVRTALTNLTSTFLKYVQGFSSKYGTKLLETVSACWLHKRTIFDWKRLFLTLTFGSR